MRNYLLLLFMCLFACGAEAQDEVKLLDVLPQKDGKALYSGVVTVDSVSADELYKRAKLWLVNVYRSAKDVIQLDDKDAKRLIGKGYLPTTWQVTFYYSTSVSLLHTIDLQFKDGRYKYEITDLFMDHYVQPDRYTQGGNQHTPIEKLGGGFRDENARKYYKQVDSKIKTTIQDLDKALRAPAKDW